MRARLLGWYQRARRNLPWRRTRDPYRIWLSEIMLQQTRVAAVIPYYERFLERFPDVESLARAPEGEVLRLWSGLGYYRRARNLRKAARQIVERGGFPRDYEEVRALAGVGDYTAAAVASIAFGLPHAVLDGNVKRVLVRLLNDDEADLRTEAVRLLDPRDPGRFNQALMELGATVCLPCEPRCQECPLASLCKARRAGTERELPAKRLRPKTVRLERTLLVIRRHGRILLAPSARIAGFWDLPEPFPGVLAEEKLGEFRHSITHHAYRFTVRRARVSRVPEGLHWRGILELHEIPLSTIAKKALAVLDKAETGRKVRAAVKRTL